MARARTPACRARAPSTSHGFYGDYQVSVKESGRELTGTFTFTAQSPQPIEVKLN